MSKVSLFLVSALTLFSTTSSCTKIIKKIETDKAPTENQIKLPENVKVLATTTQNYNNYTKTGMSLSNSFYLPNFYSILRRKDVQGIEEAHNILSKKGYIVKDTLVKPVATPKILNAFIKGEIKHRFALLVNGLDNSKKYSEFKTRENQFKKSVEYLHTILINNFGIRKSSTYKVDAPSLRDSISEPLNKVNAKAEKKFFNNLDSIARKIEQLKQNKNKQYNDIELFIYYRGHGNTYKTTKKIIYEGQKEGYILDGAIDEAKFNKFIKKHPVLSKIKILFLLEDCTAGAWIAERTKKTAKKYKKFLAARKV